MLLDEEPIASVDLSPAILLIYKVNKQSVAYRYGLTDKHSPQYVERKRLSTAKVQRDDDGNYFVIVYFSKIYINNLISEEVQDEKV